MSQPAAGPLVDRLACPLVDPQVFAGDANCQTKNGQGWEPSTA